MGRFQNTQYVDTVNNITDAMVSFLDNPYYNNIDKHPWTCDYLHINKNFTTLDEGSQQEYAFKGQNSPIRYDLIKNFVLFGPGNRIETNLNREEFGISGDIIEGEFYVLPDTIIPYPGDDINLDRFDELGHVTKYRDTPVELVPERVKDADVVVINKIPMNEKTLAGASHLKLVAVTATGMDNIDRAYTDSHGILSANVAGYSTEAVAQHTFALMFYVLHKLAYYDHYVKSGAYCTSAQFSHFEQKFSELDGKTWGIVGMGAIGKRVASHAQEFGCNVIYYSTSGKNTDQLYERVDLWVLYLVS